MYTINDIRYTIYDIQCVLARDTTSKTPLIYVNFSLPCLFLSLCLSLYFSISLSLCLYLCLSVSVTLLNLIIHSRMTSLLMHHLRLHLSNICVHKTNLHVLLSIRFVTFLRSFVPSLIPSFLVSRFLSLSLSNGTNSMYIPLLVMANTCTHTTETLQNSNSN